MSFLPQFRLIAPKVSTQKATPVQEDHGATEKAGSHILYGFQGCIPISPDGIWGYNGIFVKTVKRLLSIQGREHVRFELVHFGRVALGVRILANLVQVSTPDGNPLPASAEQYFKDHIENHSNCRQECAFFIKLPEERTPLAFEPKIGSKVLKLSTINGKQLGATCYVKEAAKRDEHGDQTLRKRNMGDFHAYTRTALGLLHCGPDSMSLDDLSLDISTLSEDWAQEHQFQGVGLAPCGPSDLRTLRREIRSAGKAISTARNLRNKNILFVPGHYLDRNQTDNSKHVEPERMVEEIQKRIRMALGDSEADKVDEIQYFSTSQFKNPTRIGDGVVGQQTLPMNSPSVGFPERLQQIITSGQSPLIVLHPIWKEVERDRDGNETEEEFCWVDNVTAKVRLPGLFSTVKEMWQWARSIFEKEFERSPSNMYLRIQPSHGYECPNTILSSYYVGPNTTDVEWFRIRASVVTRRAVVGVVDENESYWLESIQDYGWGPRYGEVAAILNARGRRKLGNFRFPEERLVAPQCGRCGWALQCNNCAGDNNETNQNGDNNDGVPLVNADFLSLREQNKLKGTIADLSTAVHNCQVPCTLCRQPEPVLFNLRDLPDHILRDHAKYSNPLPSFSELAHGVGTERPYFHPAQVGHVPPVAVNQGLAVPSMQVGQYPSYPQTVNVYQPVPVSQYPDTNLVAYPHSGILPQEQTQLTGYYAQTQPPKGQQAVAQYEVPRRTATPHAEAVLQGQAHQAPEYFQAQHLDMRMNQGQPHRVAQYGDTQVEGLPFPGMTPEEQAQQALMNLSQSQPLETRVNEEQTQPLEVRANEEQAQQGRPGTPDRNSGSAAPAKAPFQPPEGWKCSMCMRSVPKPGQGKKNPKKRKADGEEEEEEKEISIEEQMKMHMDPTRNCRIPSKEGTYHNLPNRSGWINSTHRDAVGKARHNFRTKYPEFQYKIYPYYGTYNNSSRFIEDPNNEANKATWNLPWPDEIQRRLDAEELALSGATGVAGGDAVAAPAKNSSRKKRKRPVKSVDVSKSQAAAEPGDGDGEYRYESEADSGDGLEPDVDDTISRKRRRQEDPAYRPLAGEIEAEVNESVEASPSATTRGGRGRRGARRAARGGRQARTNSTRAVNPAQPAAAREGVRKSTRRRKLPAGRAG